MGVSVVFARSLLQELTMRGKDVEGLLGAAGIAPDRLRDVRNILDPDECERLVDAAVQLTGDESIGLSIGAGTPEHALHVFGHVMLAQPTLRAACAEAERYAEMIATGPTWRLLEADDAATWGLVSALRPGRLRRVLMDFAVVLMQVLGQSLSPPGSQLEAVSFQHEAPDYADLYARFFACPVRFNQPISGLTFPRNILDLPRLHADGMVAVLARSSAEQLSREREQAPLTSARVRDLLRYRADLATITLERVARECKLSSRVLRRRLLEEGLSFTALVDEARCRSACAALRRPGTTTQEIADSLGFSEPSAFFRAFKRWTGSTPTQFRRASQPSQEPKEL